MSAIALPSHYHLEIRPDLNRFRFDGRVTIDMDVAQAGGQVHLHLLELAVWQCRVRNGGQWRDCGFRVDPKEEALVVDLPPELQGGFQLRIDYDGRINDRMAGFYRSGYRKDGETRHIGVTQFQESSARQAFPCMDHPRYKATFDLVLTVPRVLTAIANTPAAQTEDLEDGSKRVTFERTPKMSTYLVFFGVGEFEFHREEGDPRVRVVTLPGLGHTVSLGLTFGREALRYCEQYYGIDYPLSKMDLIAVPDFAFGAMENWGAITFRENLLLNYPDTTSAEGVERICEVIAHEIAHQWFGNLVTPSDWKYLWLNESFATYFGYGVVAEIHPDWGTWDQFLHTQTASALVRDGLKATFPIEIPGGEHVVINSSTAPIIYNKGASMLRMIQGHIGPDTYQEGVRTYLRRHAYDCAESYHLWEAFEDAAAIPVTAMVKSWVGQSGYPMVTVKRDGDKLHLGQHRFTYLPAQSDQVWMVPVTLQSWNKAGETQTRNFIMDAAAMTVDLPPDARVYKLNAGQTGFYRVDYEDGDNLAALGALVRDNTLPATDRWGLQNDLYALMRAGRRSLDDYLDFLGHYEQEREYLPLVSLAANLQQVHNVVSEEERGGIVAFGAALAQRVLDHIGMQPEEGEPHTRAALRNQLLWLAAAWGEPAAIGFGLAQFDRMMAGENVHPDIARSVIQIGALQKGAEALAWFKQRFAESPSEHERMNILSGLVAFGQWDLIEEALAFSLKDVPPRNRFIPIAAAAGNVAAAPHMWDWYQRNLRELEDFHPLLYERVITGIVPLGGLEQEPAVTAFFNDYVEAHPQFNDAVELALEYLSINLRTREAV